MKSLRIRENPLGFYTFTGKYLTWQVQIRKSDIVYWCTKYGLQHDINSFALRRSWGGLENAKMVFAELNCHVFMVENIR